MKRQSNIGYKSNDDVMTPDALALQIVRHFNPKESFLEPCSGEGAFIRALHKHDRSSVFTMKVYSCEIKEGRDFLQYDGPRVSWIITNPPFSQFKAFLERSFKFADNVVFLVTINHAMGLKARLRLCDEYGFGIREVLLVDTPPKPWPQTGFQVGAVHWQQGYKGDIRWSDKRGLITYR